MTTRQHKTCHYDNTSCHNNLTTCPLHDMPPCMTTCPLHDNMPLKLLLCCSTSCNDIALHIAYVIHDNDYHVSRSQYIHELVIVFARSLITLECPPLRSCATMSRGSYDNTCTVCCHNNTCRKQLAASVYRREQCFVFYYFIAFKRTNLSLAMKALEL